MAKSAKLTAAERKDLESIGWSEDNPFNVPENVSPVLKSKIIEQYKKDEGLVSPLDMPSATEAGNQYARARAAEDGDEHMQKYLEDAQKNAETNTEGKTAIPDQPKVEEKAGTEKNSGIRRQNELNK